MGSKDEAGKKFEVHRLKARILLDDGTVKVVQGVREIFEIKDSLEKDANTSNAVGKMVLIGRHMGDVNFEQSLLNVITAP